MKKTSSIVIAVISFLIFGGISFYLVSKLFEPDVQETLIEVALELNKQAPIQVDEETRLDSATVTGDKIFDYYYTLIYRSDMVNKDTIAKYIKPGIIAQLKSSQDMSYFKEHEVTLNYNYYGYDGKHAVSLKITPDLYKD
ncbi:hypothetical protein [Leeuwenhoekiella marinoflava]|uniref:hypothetical protein n=1 Tax=Leeuwenhoekiella marinoflava TaxID=988 RepID=UPI0030010D6E